MKRLFLIAVFSFFVFNPYYTAAQIDSSKFEIKKKHIAGAVSVIEMSTRVNHRGYSEYKIRAGRAN